MYEEKVVLCGANSYTEKYYLNPDFEQLPDDIKNELKIMCVLYVHDVGGILTLVYEEDGSLCFEVASEEGDPMFDDIGSTLKIKKLQTEKQEEAAPSAAPVQENTSVQAEEHTQNAQPALLPEPAKTPALPQTKERPRYRPELILCPEQGRERDSLNCHACSLHEGCSAYA